MSAWGDEIKHLVHELQIILPRGSAEGNRYRAYFLADRQLMRPNALDSEQQRALVAAEILESVRDWKASDTRHPVNHDNFFASAATVDSVLQQTRGCRVDVLGSAVRRFRVGSRPRMLQAGAGTDR